MAFALRIVDRTAGGPEQRETLLHLASERVTARELIETRVRQEVSTYNKNRSDYYIH